MLLSLHSAPLRAPRQYGQRRTLSATTQPRLRASTSTAVDPARIPEPVASGSEPPKYQYQRAYILSKDLSDQLYTFSTEQINQIRTQNVYVQRATEAAHRVTAVASTSYGAAQEKVHAVSDVMLQELQRVQVRLISVLCCGSD